MTLRGLFLRSILSGLTALTVPGAANAGGDGMYIPVPEKLPREQIKKLALEISPEEISKIAHSAVVRITPGCSSTFMSPDGLLGTNWHCADPCVSQIQAKARKEHGPDHPHARIRETGFVASNFDEEIVCRGGEARVTTAIENISSSFTDLLENRDLNAHELHDQIRKRKEEIREDCMRGKDNVICEVAFMNNEKEPFYLFEYRKFTDVRLVWIVPTIIGGFGGNTDNWEYPRHCGDFAFLRVYDNGKPYHPKEFVPASPEGVKPGDPQFILGFPGTTERNIPSHAAEFMERISLRYHHRVYGALTDKIELLHHPPKKSPYSSSWLYLENYFENFKRKADMIRDLGIVDEKRKLEQKRTPGSNSLRRTKAIYRDSAAFYPTKYLLDLMTNRRSPAKSFLAASYIWQWSTQPGNDRDRSDNRFKSWNENRLRATIDTADDITTLEGEKGLMATYFELADSLPVRIQAFDELRARTRSRLEACFQDPGNESFSCGALYRMTVYDQMAEVLYRETEMIAKDDSEGERKRVKALRRKLFEMSPQDLVASQDSLLLLAKRVVDQLKDMKSDWEVAAPYTYELTFLNHRQALLMDYETPDANSTIRFTLSRVQKEYEPIYKDGIFGYTTTLSSMIGRDRFLPESAEEYEEFLVPEEIKEAHRRLSSFQGKFFFDKELNDVPINFITQHTITGGNSGSGVFNARGEIVGFAFDGTPEAILSDLDLHPNSRTIIVDIRYPGFLGNEIFPEAKRILREIGLPTY